jgi:hypothetical protein
MTKLRIMKSNIKEKKWVTEELTLLQLHRRIQRLEEICEMLLQDRKMKQDETE